MEHREATNWPERQDITNTFCKLGGPLTHPRSPHRDQHFAFCAFSSSDLLVEFYHVYHQTIRSVVSL